MKVRIKPEIDIIQVYLDKGARIKNGQLRLYYLEPDQDGEIQYEEYSFKNFVEFNNILDVVECEECSLQEARENTDEVWTQNFPGKWYKVQDNLGAYDYFPEEMCDTLLKEKLDKILSQ